MKPEEIAALAADGDRYHRVNHDGIGTIADPVFAQMQVINSVAPIRSVLEIGCTTGFRLDKAQREFSASCCGLEASPAAVVEGQARYPQVDIRQGVAPADLNQFAGSTFDVVVVGHLLYLLPRSDLF
jgi:SAM-dependent methyltransferase